MEYRPCLVCLGNPGEAAGFKANRSASLLWDFGPLPIGIGRRRPRGTCLLRGAFSARPITRFHGDKQEKPAPRELASLMIFAPGRRAQMNHTTSLDPASRFGLVQTASAGRGSIVLRSRCSSTVAFRNAKETKKANRMAGLGVNQNQCRIPLLQNGPERASLYWSVVCGARFVSGGNNAGMVAMPCARVSSTEAGAGGSAEPVSDAPTFSGVFCRAGPTALFPDGLQPAISMKQTATKPTVPIAVFIELVTFLGAREPTSLKVGCIESVVNGGHVAQPLAFVGEIR